MISAISTLLDDVNLTVSAIGDVDGLLLESSQQAPGGTVLRVLRIRLELLLEQLWDACVQHCPQEEEPS